MSKQKHYDVIHSEWITVKAKSEKEAYKKAEKTITKMIAEGSEPDFEDGLHDMFISDVREEEEEMYTIEVYYKNNYVNGLCYPHCSRAKEFAKEANEKTLSRSSLKHIRSLGYTINVVPFEEVSDE